MKIHRDHVAGGAFIVLGALVLAASGDLPFGTLASPGAGMLPTLLTVLMMGFGFVIVVQGHGSPLLAEADWSDLAHAARVVAAVAAAAWLLVPLGFVITAPLLLLGLMLVVERRPLLPVLAFSIAAPGLFYALIALLLRTPLPRGPLGF